jgi:hypothetical protein
MAFALLLVALAGRASAAPQVTCHAHDDAQVIALFDAWAADVRAGDSKAVGGRYTNRAQLKPDDSKAKPLRSAKARLAFIKTWLARQPSLEVIKRHVTLKCNSVVDAGSYAVHFGDGSSSTWRYEMTYDWNGKQWLISKHLMKPIPTPG